MGLSSGRTLGEAAGLAPVGQPVNITRLWGEGMDGMGLSSGTSKHDLGPLSDSLGEPLGGLSRPLGLSGPRL